MEAELQDEVDQDGDVFESEEEESDEEIDNIDIDK